MIGFAAVTWSEEALRFDCGGGRLLGILTRPIEPAQLGVVILPGGAQYRAGAHRQNVLIARALAERGIATLRIDASGMGDSDGAHPGFVALGPDIQAALSALRSAVPSLNRTVLCGLCDAASAIILELPSLSVDGAILLNPWARSDKTLAAAQIRAYYPRQILSPLFWQRFLAGRINLMTKAEEFLHTFAASRRADDNDSLARQLHAALSSQHQPMLVILAGEDITAAEFEGAVLHRIENRCLEDLTVARIAGANHTFSSAEWRQEALEQMLSWLTRWQPERVRHRETSR